MHLFPTLSFHPETNSFNISSLVFSKSLLTPTAHSRLAFSSLSILLHSLEPTPDTTPAERRRASREELMITYRLNARLPLKLKSELFPILILSPSSFGLLTHVQRVISQPRVLSHGTVTYSDIPHLRSYICFPFLAAVLGTCICLILISLISAISAFYQNYFGL